MQPNGVMSVPSFYVLKYLDSLVNFVSKRRQNIESIFCWEGNFRVRKSTVTLKILVWSVSDWVYNWISVDFERIWTPSILNKINLAVTRLEVKIAFKLSPNVFWHSLPGMNLTWSGQIDGLNIV